MNALATQIFQTDPRAGIRAIPTIDTVDVTKTAQWCGHVGQVLMTRRAYNGLAIDPDDHGAESGWARLHDLLWTALIARSDWEALRGANAGVRYTKTRRADDVLVIDVA